MMLLSNSLPPINGSILVIRNVVTLAPEVLPLASPWVSSATPDCSTEMTLAGGSGGRSYRQVAEAVPIPTPLVPVVRVVALICNAGCLVLLSSSSNVAKWPNGYGNYNHY